MSENITNEGMYEYDEEMLKKVAEDLTASGIDKPIVQDVKTTDIFGYIRKPAKAFDNDEILDYFNKSTDIHIESDGTTVNTKIRAGKFGPTLNNISKLTVEFDAEEPVAKATIEFFIVTTDITVLKDQLTRKLNVIKTNEFSPMI